MMAPGNWKGHILVVEDNDLDYERITRILSRVGFRGRQTRARDGMEALELMRAPEGLDYPTVVLADLNMPRLNGLEMIAEMRRDPNLRKVPVHVLTTSSHPSDISKAWGESISGYHVKPSQLGEMSGLVSTLIEVWERTEFDPHQ